MDMQTQRGTAFFGVKLRRTTAVWVRVQIDERQIGIRCYLRLRVPGRGEGGPRLGAAWYVSGTDRINVRGRDRNREAKTRRKGIRKTGKGNSNKGRVKWTSIYVRQEARWADDDVTSKQGASCYTRSFSGRPPD
jgi:hypothetical protein